MKSFVIIFFIKTALFNKNPQNDSFNERVDEIVNLDVHLEQNHKRKQKVRGHYNW